MHFLAIRTGLRRLQVAAAAAGAASVLFAAPAVASDTITVSPAIARTGDTVLICGQAPVSGGASCPAKRNVTQVGPVAPPAPAKSHRRWIFAGTLLIGIFVFLGVAEWKPWRRRGS